MAIIKSTMSEYNIQEIIFLAGTGHTKVVNEDWDRVHIWPRSSGSFGYARYHREVLNQRFGVIS